MQMHYFYDLVRSLLYQTDISLEFFNKIGHKRPVRSCLTQPSVFLTILFYWENSKILLDINTGSTMITISTNKGLTKVEKWEDIQTRPGFLPDLNPADHELDSIIGRYIFPEKIRCGLSNCHTLHTRGYIVSTKSGRETNIGKDCGKTYFGVDFELQARKFDRDITESENRDLLWNFSFQLDEVERKIEALRKGDRGADWVNKNVQILKNPGRIPNEIVRRLATMAKTQSNVLMAAREATEKEIKRLEESEKRSIKRPYVIEEPIAEIAGIDALYPENDLRKLIVIDLEEELKSFKSV